LIAAVEFTYVMGIIRPLHPRSASAAWRTSHASTVSSYEAISAIEHPAERSGRITSTESGVSMSAVSAMKWTPQKTTHLTSWPGARSPASLAAICDSFSESPV
jgi:hypothetical protein